MFNPLHPLFVLRERYPATARFLAYAVVIAAAMYAVFRVNDSAIDRERESQVQACQRVQVLRDQTNGIAFLVYEAFNEASKRQSQILEKNPKDAEARRAAKETKRVAQRQVVTGPVDCVASVDRPTTYRPPTPEFIYLNGPRVKVAKKRAQAIIDAARSGKRLPPVEDILSR